MLTGGGTVTLASTTTGSNAQIIGTFLLTNVDNLIQGEGNLGANATQFINQADGTIAANVSGRTLVIDPNGNGFDNQGLLGSNQRRHPRSVSGNAGGAFTNSGTIVVSGGTLQFDGTVTSSGTVDVGSDSLSRDRQLYANAGTFRLAGGTVTSATALEFDGGLVDARGTINAAITNSALFQPALGGTGLNVTGNVSLLSASQLSFQLGGLTQGTEYGFLNVNGTVALGGQLVLSFANGFQNSVTGSDTFTLLASNFNFSGVFSNIISGDRLDTADGFGSFVVTYSGNNLVLSDFVPAGSAIEAIWTGSTGNWSDGTKWNINPNFPNNGQPEVGDLYDVTLDNGGTITLNLPITIQKFTLNSGTVTGANSLTTNDLFSWTGGTLSGGIVVNANGGLSLNGTGAITLNGATLNNPLGQTATDSGVHTFVLANGAVFNNEGTFLAQNNNGLLFGGGTGTTFNNDGTFTRDTGTGTYTINGGIAFNNFGTVNIDSGVLALNGGGDATGGIFNIGLGATLRFNAAYGFGLTTTLAGAGTIDFVAGTQTISGPYNVTGTTSVSGATVTFSNSVTIPTLSFTGGTINIASGQTFDLTSLFNWTIGTLGGGGTFNPEAGLSLNGTGAITLNGATLNNPLGQTATDSGVHTFVLANGAVFNNEGTFLAQNNNGLLFGGGTGTTFNNDGTFTRDTGTGTYTINGGIAFNNFGTVNIDSGVLALNGGGDATGGIFNIGLGATLRFNAAYGFGLTTTLAGAGTIDFVAGTQTISGPYNVTGTTSVSGATVTFSNSVTIPTLSFTGGTINIASGQTFDLTSLFNWTIGTLGGGGTFNPEAGLSLNGTGAITLNGATLNNPLGQTATDSGVHTFVLANGAVLNNEGTFLAQNNNGLLFGGGTGTTFNNDGTFTRDTGTGTYTINGGIAFNNFGTVNIDSGVLALNGGGDATGGIFNIGLGATLRFNAAYGFGLTTTLAGAGTIDFVAGTQTISGPYNVTGTTSVSGATVTFSNWVTIPTLSFTGGTINIASGQTFDLTSLFNWTIGTLGGGGTFNPEAGLSLNGTGAITLNGATLNNPLGQTATDSGVHTFVLANGAVFNNEGTFLAQNNNGLLFGGGTGTAFNNNGTFTRNTGTGTYTFGGGIAFNNSGTVNASSGTLAFNGGYTQTDGTLDLDGGTVSSTTALNLQGGLLTGVGNINAAITNSALIQPGLGVGGLNVTGNVSLLSASQFSFQLGGLTQGSQYGFLNVNGTVALGGQLVLSFANGFQNSVTGSDTFTLLASSFNFSGVFSNIVSGSRLVTADGFGSFVVTYSGNNLVLSDWVPAGSTIEAIWTGNSGNWSDGTKWSIDPNFPNNGQPDAAISTTLPSTTAERSASTFRSRFRSSP